MKKLLVLFLGSLALNLKAQKSPDPVYVDGQGVMRWTKDKTEAAFFGVNYTVPFAYGYRSVKARGIDPEEAIDADVHHMRRLGLDAFRVHVWDVELSDSMGNLLNNEHLRLFDYLIHKLKEYKIKILITPIAFWGNGYPEPDIKTNGFSYVHGKGPAVVNEAAFTAQENYLKQFLTHVNPYTKLAYKDDADVIAMEINNEPHHSGPKERTTEYVNRMAEAVRSTGWTKPVFYNISESPAYADAVVKARVDGHSFQWYPTGLVAGRELKGNFLPNVDEYHIPFGDTIPAFRKRARMIYEFDAGDVMKPVMYPAMARSYRTAGFQWATQFAYDPLYTAYANTEYQTHYLNLAYTPSKAISLLIASKVFHRIPRWKQFGGYPADTSFDVFRVSYRQGLSEMNSVEEFYYSASTVTQPKDVAKLQHIAGVGSSPIVEYEGRGAYFLDKIAPRMWRLEVMPDAIPVSDPFEKASPRKEVVTIRWNTNRMKIRLPELGQHFSIVQRDQTNGTHQTDGADASGREGFGIAPGVYYLVAKETTSDFANKREVFYAPAATSGGPLLWHSPLTEVTAGKTVSVVFGITGADAADVVSVEVRNSTGQWKTVPAERQSSMQYLATIPAEMLAPGIVTYRLMIRQTNGDAYTFPGGLKGDPYAWDEYRNQSWQMTVRPQLSPIELFSAQADRNTIMLYNTDWRNNKVEYVTVAEPNGLSLRTVIGRPASGTQMGWQFYFGDKVKGRKPELSSFTSLVLRIKGTTGTSARLALIDADGFAYGAMVPGIGEEWQDIRIPLASLKKDSSLLLPRPYPGFQKLWFTAAGDKPFSITDAEKLEIVFTAQGASTSSAELQVQWVRLVK